MVIIIVYILWQDFLGHSIPMHVWTGFSGMATNEEMTEVAPTIGVAFVLDTLPVEMSSADAPATW